jgi:hypothetical protein
LRVNGIDPAKIPAGLNVPSGPSYWRLILWLLSLGQNLPMRAIPDATELYLKWSSAMSGHDRLTILQQWLYRWLTQVETAIGPGG